MSANLIRDHSLGQLRDSVRRIQSSSMRLASRIQPRNEINRKVGDVGCTLMLLIRAQTPNNFVPVNHHCRASNRKWHLSPFTVIIKLALRFTVANTFPRHSRPTRAEQFAQKKKIIIFRSATKFSDRQTIQKNREEEVRYCSSVSLAICNFFSLSVY